MIAFVGLFGAAINAELEHQTERDTTAGDERPVGERGAHIADTVGPTRDEIGRRRRLKRPPKPTNPGVRTTF